MPRLRATRLTAVAQATRAAVAPFVPTYSFTGSSLPAPFDALTRGGLGTRIDSAGLVGYGAHNRLLQSDDLSSGSWSRSGILTPVAVGTTPGGKPFWSIIPDATSGAHSIQRTINTAGPKRMRAVVKAAGINYVIITDNTTFSRSFNLSTGAVGGVGVGVGTVTALGGGVYELYVEGTASSSTQFKIEPHPVDSGAGFTGDGVSGIWVGECDDQATPSPAAHVATTSAAKYLLRQTHHPVTHTALGLLVEGAATNLVSTNFANWSVFRSKPITVGADGWTLFEYDGVSAPSYGAYLQNAPVWVGGATYRFALDIWPGQATQTIRFNYVDSNSGYTGGTSTFAFTDSGASCTITNAGGAVGTARRISPTGAWRCVVSFSVISEPTYNYIDFGQNAGVVSGSSFRARLPQVEIGSVPTSPIPNPITGSMLRVADAISDTTAYAAVFGSAGAMSVRWDDSAHGAIGKRAYDVLTCSASGTTTSEAWSIGVTAAGGVEVLCRTGGVTTTLALGAGTVGGKNTVVLSWGGGTVRASLNGGSEQSGSSAPPACNTLHTGDSASIKGAATTIIGWINNEGTSLLGAGAVQALCATRTAQ